MISVLQDALMPKPTTPQRQRRFAQLVSIGTLSDAEAARQAGYSPASARVSAYHNRRSPAVATLIKAESEFVANQFEITREEVIGALKREMYHSSASNARIAAAVALGKSLGMFTQKVQVDDIPTLADELMELNRRITEQKVDNVSEL